MDSAFKSRPWGSYTIAQIKGFIAAGNEKSAEMAAEIARRERVAAGDLSDSYPSERLRVVQARA